VTELVPDWPMRVQPLDEKDDECESVGNGLFDGEPKGCLARPLASQVPSRKVLQEAHVAIWRGEELLRRTST
jgi:hypothetical protein